MTKKQILKQVNGFCRNMEEAHTIPSDSSGTDFNSMFDRMQRIMQKIESFDKSLGEGLRVGRLVQWAQGDGYAIYFVTGIGKDTCRLAHLDWIDSWHSPVVQDGIALRGAVERAVNRADAMRRIFKGKEMFA